MLFQVSYKSGAVSTSLSDLMTLLKLISYEVILDIIDPFERAPSDILSDAPSLVQVIVDLVNLDVLLESIKE